LIFFAIAYIQYTCDIIINFRYSYNAILKIFQIFAFPTFTIVVRRLHICYVFLSLEHSTTHKKNKLALKLKFSKKPVGFPR